MSVITFSLALMFCYVVWQYIIKMYYRYWYYKKQGVPSLAFPLPIIGTQHLFMKTFS